MAIGNAVQKGGMVYIYDEKGRQTGCVSAGDGMTGYTSGSVNVKKGGMIYGYNDKGRQISCVSAGRG